MTSDPFDPLDEIALHHLPKLHPGCAELQPAGKGPYNGDFNDATNVLLAGISWNLATLANEAKRIADALEQRDGSDG